MFSERVELRSEKLITRSVIGIDANRQLALFHRFRGKVAGGLVAFLRPESGAPASALCPTGTSVAGTPAGTDLNGDLDAADSVVHLWAPSFAGVVSFPFAATDIAMSATCLAGGNMGGSCTDDLECPGSICQPRLLAIAVPEAGQGGGTLNNFDVDTRDTVIFGAHLDCIRGVAQDQSAGRGARRRRVSRLQSLGDAP